MIVQLVQPLHEHHVFSLFPAVIFDLVSAQAIGFVQTDVHIFAGEAGQQRRIQVADKFKALWQQRVQGGRHLVLRFKQPQMMERGLFEPCIHVAEGILIGHQINKTLPAVTVQLPDIVGGQAVIVRRFFGIGGVFEAVAFHIQLEFVVLEGSQKINHALDGIDPRLLAPADVQHITPAGQGGLIADAHTAQLAPIVAQQLPQGGDGAE